LSFAPARYNVKWDGTSEVKATFSLTCPDTAATYAAVAYGIHNSSGSAGFCPFFTGTTAGNNPPPPYQYERGERVKYFNSSCQLVSVSDAAIPVTYSSGSVTLSFSSLTTTHATHAWKLTATKGTASRVLIAGRIERESFDPYGAGGGTINLVSGTTAYKCI
jgi:hypothetical protein